LGWLWVVGSWVTRQKAGVGVVALQLASLSQNYKVLNKYAATVKIWNYYENLLQN